ncbi:hypothetical protein AKJ09_00781 [Labilithrix luteola]|uniref:Uncharacterized protein n=1 Tax=Labilithrix luteola TaxID=1391654 RepID=A0A0K1PKS0_9BACT|nr:hypothetical protein AKJ09_00781 [Labilithrix luteola]
MERWKRRRRLLCPRDEPDVRVRSMGQAPAALALRLPERRDGHLDQARRIRVRRRDDLGAAKGRHASVPAGHAHVDDRTGEPRRCHLLRGSRERERPATSPRRRDTGRFLEEAGRGHVRGLPLGREERRDPGKRIQRKREPLGHLRYDERRVDLRLRHESQRRPERLRFPGNFSGRQARALGPGAPIPLSVAQSVQRPHRERAAQSRHRLSGSPRVVERRQARRVRRAHGWQLARLQHRKPLDERRRSRRREAVVREHPQDRRRGPHASVLDVSVVQPGLELDRLREVDAGTHARRQGRPLAHEPRRDDEDRARPRQWSRRAPGRGGKLVGRAELHARRRGRLQLDRLRQRADVRQHPDRRQRRHAQEAALDQRHRRESCRRKRSEPPRLPPVGASARHQQPPGEWSL